MKLTKRQLVKLIKEELGQMSEKGYGYDPAALPKLLALAEQLEQFADRSGFTYDSGERVTRAIEALLNAINGYMEDQKKIAR